MSPDKTTERVWLAWEDHRRTRELCRSLGVDQRVVFDIDAARPIRYPYLLSRTLLFLLQKRPRQLIVQSPSVVLAFFAVTLGSLLTHSVIVDSHNEGLGPFQVKWRWLLPLYRLIQRRADLTIVTNVQLAHMVACNGGRAFVLADKIPTFRTYERVTLCGERNVVLICTFEKDEPFEQVLQAARLLDETTKVYFTGRCERVPQILMDQAPENVIFTGYLAEQRYINLLYSADVIIDLTLMENCLVCGAYEALSLGKPMVLSDTVASRSYFSKGAVYTGNEPGAIADATREALARRDALADESRSLRKSLDVKWEARFECLRMKLDLIV